MIILKVHINIRKLNGLVTVSVRAKFFVLDLQRKQRGLALKLETLTAPPGTMKLLCLNSSVENLLQGQHWHRN